MRIYTAALSLEANTFSPLPTSYESFTEKLYFPPGQHPDHITYQTNVVWVARTRARRDGYTLIEGSCYAAQPGGTAARAAYERMRDEILAEIRAALPLDGILLALHGAMVAHGYDDCEGDLIERARSIVGPKCTIGVELDLHCHTTRKRCRAADVLVFYKEYPHTDFEARAHELIDIVLGTIRGKLKPRVSVFDCCVMSMFPTSREPMRSFVDKCSALEGKDRVLSVSIGHGFADADVPEMGARMLVMTDDNKAHGDRLAEELGRELIEIAKVSSPPLLSPDDAISAALAEPPGKPVVIADTTDNPGGGAPADNTTFLRLLIMRKVAGAAVAPIWDPVAARICHAAGVGARMPLRFGGKTAVTSGTPIDAEIEVLACHDNAYQTFAGSPVPIGRSVSIRCVESGVEAVLITTRAQAMGLDLFSQFAIDPLRRRILVVKSNQHFYDAFAPIASRVIYADGDGPQPQDFRRLTFKRLDRALWPLSDAIEPKLIL